MVVHSIILSRRWHGRFPSFSHERVERPLKTRKMFENGKFRETFSCSPSFVPQVLAELVQRVDGPGPPRHDAEGRGVRAERPPAVRAAVVPRDRPAQNLGGWSGSTPRFPNTHSEIVKIHDFPSNLIDFHGKSMKNRGFSRFPNVSLENWVSI